MGQQKLRHGNIGRQHEFFDDPVRIVALKGPDIAHPALFIKIHPDFAG